MAGSDIRESLQKRGGGASRRTSSCPTGLRRQPESKLQKHAEEIGNELKAGLSWLFNNANDTWGVAQGSDQKLFDRLPLDQKGERSSMKANFPSRTSSTRSSSTSGLERRNKQPKEKRSSGEAAFIPVPSKAAKASVSAATPTTQATACAQDEKACEEDARRAAVESSASAVATPAATEAEQEPDVDSGERKCEEMSETSSIRNGVEQDAALLPLRQASGAEPQWRKQGRNSWAAPQHQAVTRSSSSPSLTTTPTPLGDRMQMWNKKSVGFTNSTKLAGEKRMTLAEAQAKLQRLACSSNSDLDEIRKIRRLVRELSAAAANENS